METNEAEGRGARTVAVERDRVEALALAYERLEAAGTEFRTYTRGIQTTLGQVEGTLVETQDALKAALHRARESETLVRLLRGRNERLEAQVRGLGAKPETNGERGEATLEGGAP